MFWQTKHAKSREWNERNTFCSMYCTHSSEWELFGRNTRSAIQGTSSSPQRVSGPLKLKQNLAFLFARRRGTLAFGNKVAKNVAGDIGRLVPPLSPKIENFRGPHRKITLFCKSVEQTTQREPLVSRALKKSLI